MASTRAKVREAASSTFYCVKSSDSILDVAKLMAKEHLGFVPVMDGDNLVGTITDRDLAVRIIAENKSSSAKVSEAMSKGNVACVYEDDDLEEAARRMGSERVRRLVVLSRSNNKPIGILALGDLATAKGGSEQLAGHALASISRYGGVHDQSGTKGAEKSKLASSAVSSSLGSSVGQVGRA